MRLNRLPGLATCMSIPLLFALHSSALAQTCDQACGLQNRACSADALPTMLACKLDCRQTVEPVDLGECMHECMDAFTGSKDVCRGDVEACEASCNPEGDDEGSGGDTGGDDGTGGDGGGDISVCVNTCGASLGTCATGVTTTSKSCIEVCREGTHRKSCFRDCAAAARDSAKICASDFRSCMRDECGAPPPIVHCQNAEAPACGGICRFMSQVCAEVEPGQCGCVRD